jgi:NAD binding domain of 6-phosphogluconate dehydrogenase
MFANEKIGIRSRLGLIGLGFLGSRIVRRHAAGFPMVVYDVVHSGAMELSKVGADIAASPSELASSGRCGVIVPPRRTRGNGHKNRNKHEAKEHDLPLVRQGRA